jgi:asparagine synthetase A
MFSGRFDKYFKSIKIQKSSVKNEDFEEWKKFFNALKVSDDYINNFLNEDLKPEDLQFLTVEELYEFIPKLSDRTKIQKHLSIK